MCVLLYLGGEGVTVTPIARYLGWHLLCSLSLQAPSPAHVGEGIETPISIESTSPAQVCQWMTYC